MGLPQCNGVCEICQHAVPPFRTEQKEGDFNLTTSRALVGMCPSERLHFTLTS